MRAWQTTRVGRPSEALFLNPDAPSPEPYAGTLLLDVLVAGIGLPDALMCEGSYAFKPPHPFTQGQEVVGRIAAPGPGVGNRRIGDRVMAVTSFFTGHGSFAEQCLALDDFCLPVPEEMTDPEAAGFLIPLHTAYIGLCQRARLEAGETLLVLGGAGGTGSAALQLGRVLGARVLTTAGGPEKVAFCRSLGADHVIDYRSEDIAEAVLAATDGKGADVIYDPVGGATFTQATRCIAQEGRLLAIGFASGGWGQVDMGHLVQRNYSVMGVIPSGYDRAFKERAQARLVQWWREGRIQIPIDEAVPFEALPLALERLKAGSVRGKLALVVDPGARLQRPLLPGEPGFVFDPLSAEYDRDPYPILAHLREHAPVFEWDAMGAIFLTRHRDVVGVLGDEEHFSGDRRLWEHHVPPPPEHANHPIIRLQASNILAYDGAEHTRLRKLASVALTRRAVRTLDPLMHSLADELIDRFIERGHCDFVEEFAAVFPVTIVSRLLGIPPNSERELRFKSLADSAVVAFNPMCSEADQLRSIHSLAIHFEEVRELMEEKRRHPANDLMTDMVQAESDGDRFTPDEIMGLVMAIIVAGSETTANSLSFGLIELLRHPEQLALFRDVPSSRPHAGYEIVRYQHPGRFLPRIARKATEIAGVAVREGQMVLCSVPSAQRDPAAIPDPDRFDITRTPVDMSSFGVGRHFCIGAQLARLELEIALGRVLERLGEIELEGDFDSIPYRANPAVRGPAALPIRFEKGTARPAHSKVG